VKTSKKKRLKKTFSLEKILSIYWILRIPAIPSGIKKFGMRSKVGNVELRGKLKWGSKIKKREASFDLEEPSGGSLGAR
jgi:hypothetical protein